MKKKSKEIPLEEEKVKVHNICGHFSEKDVVWNVLRLEPGHDILISAIDNSEYTLTKDKKEMYANVIRSNTYFWRPLSEYDGLNPVIPDRSKSKNKVLLEKE